MAFWKLPISEIADWYARIYLISLLESGNFNTFLPSQFHLLPHHIVMYCKISSLDCGELYKRESSESRSAREPQNPLGLSRQTDRQTDGGWTELEVAKGEKRKSAVLETERKVRDCICAILDCFMEWLLGLVSAAAARRRWGRKEVVMTGSAGGEGEDILVSRRWWATEGQGELQDLPWFYLSITCRTQ